MPRTAQARRPARCRPGVLHGARRCGRAAGRLRHTALLAYWIVSPLADPLWAGGRSRPSSSATDPRTKPARPRRSSRPPTGCGDVPLKVDTIAAGGSVATSTPRPRGTPQGVGGQAAAGLGWSRQHLEARAREAARPSAATPRKPRPRPQTGPCRARPRWRPLLTRQTSSIPGSLAVPAALQAEARASLETQRASMTSHTKGLADRQEATEQREAARVGGAHQPSPRPS